MTEFEGFLTVTQAAARLGVHRATIWRHIQAGHLLPFRSARNASVRLLDVAEIEAIEKVTLERGRVRKDWSGMGWADLLIEAHANREGAAFAELLTGDVWPEAEPERRTIAGGVGVPKPATGDSDQDLAVLDAPESA